MRLSTILYVMMLCFCVSWCAGSASAQDYTLYKIPKGHRVTVASGEIMQGYTLAEYKQLLLVDAQLKAAESKLIDTSLQIENLNKSVGDLTSIINLDEKAIAILKQEVVRKSSELTTEVASNIKLEEKLVLRQRILRIGGTVVGALVAGLVLGLAAQHL